VTRPGGHLRGNIMRVNISTTEKTQGFLRKTSYVQFSANIDFSEEELFVIRKTGLDKKMLCEKPQSDVVVKRLGKLADDPNMFNLMVGTLVREKPFTYDLDDHAQASVFKEELTEGLKLLKRHIEANSVGEQSASFEL
jgi:hypothetical protein